MRVLMCPPTEFAIPWEINPWMDSKNQPDKEKAWRQWHGVFEIYQKLRLKVLLIQPVKGLCDMIFTANAAWGVKGNFIISKFKYPERRQEQEYFKKWFRSRGFKTIEPPAEINFEGQGDFVTLKDVYLFGHGIRSSLEVRDFIKQNLNLKKDIIPLKLINPKFYHLDTCLMYLHPINAIMYFPGAFDRESLNRIKCLGVETIEVAQDEAESFVCNGVYFEDNIILCGKTERISSMLKERGLEVITTDVSEFKKSGAGIRCLTLFLD